VTRFLPMLMLLVHFPLFIAVMLVV